MKIVANDVSLYYELMGAGPPLVLIAGFTCDTLLWSSLLPELTQHFQVVVFDNRGVGQSDSPDTSYSIETMAQDAIALIDQLGLQKTHVLGHSMGGCIAQTMAVRYPTRINKLALCNSLIRLNPVSVLAQQFFLYLQEKEIPPEKLLEGIYPWLFSADFLRDTKKVNELIASSLLNPHPQGIIGFRRQLEALIAFDSSSWFHHIALPTLVINGEEDILCPRDSIRLAEGISGAQFVNFSKIGHLPLIENPSLFLKVIVDFFK
jgi:3-oxoadipate enol-lactonase